MPGIRRRRSAASMRRAVLATRALLTGAPLAAILAAGILAPSASALPFAPCLNSPGFACTSLGVPLDRSGTVGGGVTLSIERMQAAHSQSEDAVIALAGGPGQAAIPLAPAMARLIAPALATRDLIVFDQRGTGASGPISCPVFEDPPRKASVGRVFERCALQIGAARGFYTTQESVADIEAIRQATGYRRLVLYGVSYGTKVALEYAERYPQNVEALVLDSVVPTDRPDPFSLSTFAAIAPVLSELCSARTCAGITGNPLADLAQLAARVHGRPLHGYVYDGRGRRRRTSLSEVALLNLMVAGDLNPALRALLPAAVRSTLRGDPSPLLRLNLLSEGLIPNVPTSRARLASPTPRARATPAGLAGAPSTGQAAARDTHPGLPAAPALGSDGIDETLFVDTSCEEMEFPWQRVATPKTRLGEAIGALHALPKSAFYPFHSSAAWQSSLMPGCAQWPNVAPPPPTVGLLPDVPTLLLSGAQDLRTPTPNAQLIAARIPGAQLVVVPHTGHSVLGSDFSGCAQAAIKAFFGGSPVQPCKASRYLFAPTPITPTRLAYVKPVAGVPGKPGRTLAVVLDTIVDLERQVIGAILQAEQLLPSGSSFGGLRGGYARLTSSALHLHTLSFVTGVQISGTLPISNGKLVRSTLRVEGRDAARGTVRVGGVPRISGRLGGRRFDVSLAKVRLAGAGTQPPGELSLSLRFPEPALAHVG